MCAFLLVWLLCLEGLAKLLVDSDAVLHALRVQIYVGVGLAFAAATALTLALTGAGHECVGSCLEPLLLYGVCCHCCWRPPRPADRREDPLRAAAAGAPLDAPLLPA